MLRINFLGKIEIDYEGEDKSSYIGNKGCVIIYLLIQSRYKGLNREKVTSYLWADSNLDAARYNLRYNLWKIKKTIGPDKSGEHFILTDKDCCRINPEYHYFCDIEEVMRFDKNKEYSFEKLQAFRTLFQGELLEGQYFKGCDELNELILFDRIDVEKRKISMLKIFCQELFQREKFEHCVNVLREILVLEPYDDDSAKMLMNSYLCLGQRSAAISYYKNFANNLATNVGIMPSTSMKEFFNTLRFDGISPEKMESSMEIKEPVEVGKNDIIKNIDRQQRDKVIHIDGIKEIAYFWFSEFIEILVSEHHTMIAEKLNMAEIIALTGFHREIYTYVSKMIPEQTPLSLEFSEVNGIRAAIKFIEAVLINENITIAIQDWNEIDRQSAGIIKYLQKRFKNQIKWFLPEGETPYHCSIDNR